jgi:hypothetical protein
MPLEGAVIATLAELLTGGLLRRLAQNSSTAVCVDCPRLERPRSSQGSEPLKSGAPGGGRACGPVPPDSARLPPFSLGTFNNGDTEIQREQFPYAIGQPRVYALPTRKIVAGARTRLSGRKALWPQGLGGV